MDCPRCHNTTQILLLTTAGQMCRACKRTHPMLTNLESFRVRTPDGKEIHLRKESAEHAADDGRDLLNAPEACLEVTDRLGKVTFHGPK